MIKIYTIRLIRKDKQAIQGIYQKEFWMLCGIYVREFVENRDEWRDDEQQVDCNIFFDKKLLEKYKAKLKAQNEFCLADIDMRKKFNMPDKRKKMGDNLLELLENMSAVLEWDDSMKDEFSKIATMFIDCDYAYNEYLFHLFVAQMKEKRKDLLKTYRNCLNQLLDEKSQLKGQYIRYAYINCARKYERVCDEEGKIGYFDKKNLMYRAHELANLDRKFTIGNMLAGLIGLSYFPLWEQGEQYMMDAIEKEKNQKHCAFMHYALAHFYEWQREDWKEAYKEYIEIERIDKKNYRMLYKKACKAFRDNDIEKAEKLFEDIYEMMKKRTLNHWILPIELEYYYKCARFLNICGIISDEEVLRIREEEFDGSEFIRRFFDDEDKESCKNMLIETMENRGKYCR